ncbi:flagellar biosynthesis protein FliO [Arthrobacter saudimassiliensis]|uniref:Flagellar biosynthesis protein FliO n=1 Tax=Arthrobacter saudimassiliensis TaxID=1461584 RepID=A0A078MH03_9MICC|nr:flagellar biosynthesis protein FliO [Arthrobacter saudimassiliensis]
METGLLGLRVLVSLGVVLALLWWLSRRVAARTGGTGDTAPVRVLSRQAISPKASVVVVEAEGQRFMLGVTEASVNVLNATPLDNLDAADADGSKVGDGGFAASLAAAGGTADALPSRRDLRRTEPGEGASMLAGSILSPQTWRQSAAALRGRQR